MHPVAKGQRARSVPYQQSYRTAIATNSTTGTLILGSCVAIAAVTAARVRVERRREKQKVVGSRLILIGFSQRDRELLIPLLLTHGDER